MSFPRIFKYQILIPCFKDALTAETATKDTLTVHLKAIVDILVSATADIKALIGLGISINVTVVAQLLAEILIVSISF